MAYWELSIRIGKLLPITPTSIDIFQDLAQGGGVSLDALHRTHPPVSSSVGSVRSKIGAGVVLSKEGEKVWLFNRSERDVFVSSYFLNSHRTDTHTWRVCKVTPGYAVLVYDYSSISDQPCKQSSAVWEGPTDLHSVHISFIKGWGGAYSRQNILNCECWLEILMNKAVFAYR